MATITRMLGKVWDRMCDYSETANHIDNVIRYKRALRNGFPSWHDSE